MRIFYVNLAPDKSSGFGNQLYILSNSINFAHENGYDVVLFTNFLKEIHTFNFCNVSEIINIKDSNNYLKLKTKVKIHDYFDFNLSFTKAIIHFNDDTSFDVTKYIRNFFEDNKFFLSKHLTFFITVINDLNKEILTGSNRDLNKRLIDKFHNKNAISLTIDYKIKDSTITKKYDIKDDTLDFDINIDITTLSPVCIPVSASGTDLFFFCKSNIIFNDKFIDNAISYLEKNNVMVNKNVNCIHLRLEDDAISAWSKTNNVHDGDYKRILENKYIQIIEKNIKKEEPTIVLTHDYNNNVINFLRDNRYNFLTTPKRDTLRDVSAIYDCHIGQFCNNVYIGVYESSFSYLLY